MMKYKNYSNILVLNCGSSSLKYKLISMPSEKELIFGEAEKVGTTTADTSVIRHNCHGRESVVKGRLKNHRMAFARIMELIKTDMSGDESLGIDVIAHRYVHPGHFFSKTTRINSANIEELRMTLPFAPIHNPVSFSMIELCSEGYPDKPQFAVFDTSFHSNMPYENSAYAIPEKVARKLKIKKLGFHGTSHKYIMQEACHFLNRDCRAQKIISCHLGSGGASICAIDKGKSINNSMGFTPLEGLMMNTRSGDIDPCAVFGMMYTKGIPVEAAEKVLNRQSGVLGMSGESSDLRDIIAKEPDPANNIIFRMYVKRIRKYVCFYAILLKGIDIIAFTDTLGTCLPLLRQEVCKGLGIFGVDLDAVKNAGYGTGTELISSVRSRVSVLVLPTDEEKMIAREAYEAVSR